MTDTRAPVVSRHGLWLRPTSWTHHAAITDRQPGKPILIGRSFGGVIAEKATS
jgi:hypothetical protein